MAVQVPTVERFQPQPEQSVGRVDMKPLDVAGPANVVKTAANQFINEVATQYEQHVKYSAEVEGKKLAREYNDFLRGEYDGKPGKLGVKYIEGDPEPGYAKFREDSTSKYNELMGKYSGASDTLKKAITKNLNEIKYKFDDLATTSQAAQLDKYQTSVVVGDVAMTKEDMLDLSGNIDITKPDPFMDIDYSLNKIQNAWMDHGKVRGTVEVSKDEKGNEIARPSSSVAFRIAKDKSDALEAVIFNLSTSGRVDEAMAVAAKYKDDLDAASRPKINKQLETASLEKRADVEFSKIQMLPMDKAETVLKNIKDIPLQEKAREKYDTYTRQLGNLNNRQQEANFEQATQVVLARERGQVKGLGAFVSVEDMESDPVIKRLLDKMSPQQVHTLRSMVDRKSVSDPDAVYSLLEDVSTEKLIGMPINTFRQKMANIGKDKEAMFQNAYMKANDVSESEWRARIKYMMPSIEKSLQDLEVIGRKRAGRDRPRDEQDILDKAREVLIQSTDTMPKGMSLKEQEDWVIRQSIKIKEEQGPSFWEGALNKVNSFFGSSTPAPTPTNAPTPSPVSAPMAPGTTLMPTPVRPSLTPTIAPPSASIGTKLTIDQWMQVYKKENGGKLPPDRIALDNFIKGKSK